MRFDVETRIAQQVEKSLRIADAGDGMHGLRLERVERPHGAVLQVIDLVTTASARNTPACPQSPPLTTIASTSCSRDGGSRSGPAGKHSPLPMPRTPSTIATSNARARW